MKHYPYHISDFRSATAHLPRLERGIYRDLLDMYYELEHSLPLDLERLCHKLAARSNEESTCVERVLNEFFTETPSGWYHDRCEKEIARYQANNSQKAQAGKASAAKKVEKREQALNARSTDVEIPLNVTPTNQEPRTKNHIEDKPTAIAVVKKQRRCVLPDDFEPNEAGLQAAAGLDLPMELAAFRNHHAGKGTLMADWQAAWRTWVGNARKFQRATPNFAQDKADVAQQTVPGRVGRDPELLRRDADVANWVPPSAETKEKLAALRRGVAA